MKILIKYKFQISLALLTILFSCSQPKNGHQKNKTNEGTPDLQFKPIDIISGEEYEEKLLVAIKQETKKMGLYSATKNEIIPVIYDEVFSGLVNPYYVVVVQNRLQGLFDVKGKRVCENLYNGFTLSPSDSSIIAAYLGSEEKWIIINSKGERLFPEEYTKIEFLRKGLLVLTNDDYKCSLASIKGELITKFEFELLQGIGTNEINEKWYVDNDIVATAHVELKRIFINSKGEVIDK